MSGPRSSVPERDRARARAVLGLLGVLAFALELAFDWGGSQVRTTFDDLGELLAAATAGGAGLWRAFHARGRVRLSWALIGAGAVCWAAGQAIWSYYELVEGAATPFPSMADAGYLAFPALAVTGLLVRRTSGPGHHRLLRGLLDGVLVATSLFVVSWVTVLGHVYASGGDSSLTAVVSMAYPCGDLLLLTLTLVVVAHAPRSARAGTVVLASGFLLLTVADSGFAYLTASGQYQTGRLCDIGWVLGFLLIAYAATRPDSDPDPTRREVASRAALLLPYVPAAVGMGIAIYRVRGDHEDNPSLLAAGLIVLVLMVRQMLALDENRRLTMTMRHQAFHDLLTGLANRALLRDRLDHALRLHASSGHPLTLLIVDLDDFKAVNDGLGHAGGDAVLRAVAERLRAATRSGDTVARIGGDEFAVLGEVTTDGAQIAERILASLAVPVSDGLLQRASIGYVDLRTDDPTVDADELLHRADLAMYAGKRQGKGRAVGFAAVSACVPAPRSQPPGRWVSRTADPAAPRA